MAQPCGANPKVGLSVTEVMARRADPARDKKAGVRFERVRPRVSCATAARSATAGGAASQSRRKPRRGGGPAVRPRASDDGTEPRAGRTCAGGNRCHAL